MNQGATVMTRSRMDYHPPRLIDHHELGILVPDVELDRLRLERECHGRREVDLHHVSRLHDDARLVGSNAVELDVSFIDQPPGLRPRMDAFDLSKPDVEPI